MSVQNTNRVCGPYACDGLTTQFPFDFKVFNAEEAAVALGDTLDKESLLTFGADYSVVLNDDQDVCPGGTVTLRTAPAKDLRVAIISNVPNTQPDTLINLGEFFPTVIERALDRLASQIQQVDSIAQRSVRVPIFSQTRPDDLLQELKADAQAAAAANSEAQGWAENSRQQALAARASSTAAVVRAAQALDSETAAASSAKLAVTSSTASAESATSAAASASNAEASAAAAKTSAAAANTSEAAATSSAKSAFTSSTAAADSAARAAVSASNAEASETRAAASASEAKTKADIAVQTANAAKATADSAQGTANSAKFSANIAEVNSIGANATADSAKQTADAAKTTADSAVTTADTAKFSAGNALTIAQDARTKAAASLPAAQKGMPSGVAPLDAAAKVPLENLPAGAAGGVAPLGADKRIPKENSRYPNMLSAPPGRDLNSFIETNDYYIHAPVPNMPPDWTGSAALLRVCGWGLLVVQELFDWNIKIKRWWRVKINTDLWGPWCKVANAYETMGSDTPSGQIAFLAGDRNPQGWLKANGAGVSRVTYAGLFSAIGTRYGAGDGVTTFNLPDLRGEFIRGWDDERGIDSGRALGTAQAATAIRLLIDNYLGYAAGTFAIGMRNVDGILFSEGGGNLTVGSDSTFYVASTLVRSGANDNTAYFVRPRNVALMACIKI